MGLPPTCEDIRSGRRLLCFPEGKSKVEGLSGQLNQIFRDRNRCPVSGGGGLGHWVNGTIEHGHFLSDFVR